VEAFYWFEHAVSSGFLRYFPYCHSQGDLLLLGNDETVRLSCPPLSSQGGSPWKTFRSEIRVLRHDLLGSNQADDERENDLGAARTW
jgi:hypothetical protein